MRFLADMGISPRVVDMLRALGHRVVHLHEVGLDRLSDADILSKALRDPRCECHLAVSWSSVQEHTGSRVHGWSEQVQQIRLN